MNEENREDLCLHEYFNNVHQQIKNQTLVREVEETEKSNDITVKYDLLKFLGPKKIVYTKAYDNRTLFT